MLVENFCPVKVREEKKKIGILLVKKENAYCCAFPPNRPSLVSIQRNEGHPTGKKNAISALILNDNGKPRATNNATSASPLPITMPMALSIR